MPFDRRDAKRVVWEIMMNVTEKIFKNIIEGKLLKTIFNKIKQIFTKLRQLIDWALCMPARYFLAKNSPVQNNKIVFMTYNNDYICNPKYICEEILGQNLPLDIVWATTTKKISSGQYPDGVRLVVRGTYPFFKELVTAKVWVDNAVCFTWNPIRKKEEQFYLQTWHGAMGLKRIGTEDVKDRRWTMASKLNGKWVDLCISNSTFETEVFRQTHWPNTKILELGHARNDILFASDEKKREIVARVREYFGIDSDKRIALYAPTFRVSTNTKTYSLNYTRFLNTLEEKFGGEWVLLNRFHFKTKNVGGGIMDQRIYSATQYPDMQELLLAADVGITDYSSWICDYVLTGKPGFIFAPDLDSYHQERGFYYPLTETPFPVAQDNDALMAAIAAFDGDVYAEKCSAFLEKRGCKETGTATKQIVALIKAQCNLNEDEI